MRIPYHGDAWIAGKSHLFEDENKPRKVMRLNYMLIPTGNRVNSCKFGERYCSCSNSSQAILKRLLPTAHDRFRCLAERALNRSWEHSLTIV